MSKIKKGDRVLYRYKHYNNRRSYFYAEKAGIYWGLVKHTCRHTGEQLAHIQIDGNSGWSRLPVSKMTLIG